MGPGLQECVGVFKGPDAWVKEKTKAELLKRLTPLDLIDQLRDDEKTFNIAQLKKILLTDTLRIPHGLRGPAGRILGPDQSHRAIYIVFHQNGERILQLVSARPCQAS